MRAAHSSLPCAARFFTAGFSPLFTRPQAVKKLDFEFWILDIQVRRHVPQGGVLGGRINEKPPGEAEDGSRTFKPALARVTYESMGRKPHVNR